MHLEVGSPCQAGLLQSCRRRPPPGLHGRGAEWAKGRCRLSSHGQQFLFCFRLDLASIWATFEGGSGRCSGCVAFAVRQLGNSRSFEAPFSPAPHCNIDKGSGGGANEISRPLLANGGGGILKTQGRTRRTTRAKLATDRCEFEDNSPLTDQDALRVSQGRADCAAL